MKLTNGKFGEEKAAELWPDLRLTENGSIDDRNGIDGYLNGKRVQIKFDRRISKTENIYREVWEKSYPEQKWRHSKVNADIYIFVTTDKAILIPVDELAKAERNLELIQISATSMGFLIPISKIKNCEIKRCSQKVMELV